MSNLTNCPNCRSALKSGVKLLTPNKIAVINEYHEEPSEGYCSKCGNDLYATYSQKLENERKQLAKDIQKRISCIPVISVHSPLYWDYTVLDMVTVQIKTGNDAVKVSSITNPFETPSSNGHPKMKLAEDFCFTQLRRQALNQGGNAVIALNVDYALYDEFGHAMIHMAGTAVKLKKLIILGGDKLEKITELVKVNDRFKHLNQY